MIKRQSLNIGQEFSDHPIGRYRSDGPSSGEVFCEDFLVPRLQKLGDDEKLEVVLDDGVDGFGSSFLDEAFAGVVKKGFMSSEELLSHLTFRYENPDFEFFRDKIREYVREAKFNSAGQR